MAPLSIDSRSSSQSGQQVPTSDFALDDPQDIVRELYFHVSKLHEEKNRAGTLSVQDIVESLAQEGIWFWRDARFRESQDVALRLAGQSRSPYTHKVNDAARRAAIEVPVGFDVFYDIVKPCAQLFLRAFSQELVIPSWSTFVTDMKYHFDQVEKFREGQNASYIPILRDADSEKWALSICSIDGQRVSFGKDEAYLFPHTLQSTSKPVTYALGLKRDGHDFVKEWIDVEPAGRPFNTQDLDPETKRPFNASINSGAIMAAGIFASEFPSDTTWEEIVDRIRETWFDLSGNDLEIGFSRATFESEKETAYNNFAIAYNLKGRKGLPRDVNLEKMLDVYLGCCSIDITTEALSVAAATLANGGVCPITGKEVFPAHVVRDVLSETMMCGMYNQAGHFAVEVGLPAKSGVSGALMIIVPNIFGFATFSPRLNHKGNSVRGVEFCRRLVGSYRVHLFESLRSGNTGAKIDPRGNGWKQESSQIARMAWAVQVGDATATKVRDIFLFAICQTAMASPEGLSDRMLDLIRDRYREIFQASVSETLFSDIREAAQKHPKELRFLKELTKDVIIEDSMRTLIVMAMFDVIMADEQVTNEEKEVAVRVARLVGVDESIARMELNRYEQDIEHRTRPTFCCDMIDVYDADISRHRRGNALENELKGLHKQAFKNEEQEEEINSRTSVSLAEKRKELLFEKSRSSMNTSNKPTIDQEEEIVELRKEVLRLRNKLSSLSSILHGVGAIEVD